MSHMLYSTRCRFLLPINYTIYSHIFIYDIYMIFYRRLNCRHNFRAPQAHLKITPPAYQALDQVPEGLAAGVAARWLPGGPAFGWLPDGLALAGDPQKK